MSDTDSQLQIISQVEAGLSALEAENKELPDFSTPEGYARAKELRKPLVKARTTGDKARLAATKGLRDEVSRINTMWSDDILPRISAMEDPLTAGIKAIDEEKARIERENAEAEQRRIDEIEGRLNDIKMMSQAMTIEKIDACLHELDGMDMPAIFQEFADAANTEAANITELLESRKAELTKQAEEVARLEAQRKEQEEKEAELKRQQDEIEAKQREKEAELKKQQDAIEAERRELQAAKEAEERRKLKEEEQRIAQEKADREKTEAVERAKQKAIEDERQRVENERIAKEQAEEAERKRIAEEKAESERLAALAPDADKLLSWFNSLPKLPEMSSAESAQLSDEISLSLTNIGDRISAFNELTEVAA